MTTLKQALVAKYRRTTLWRLNHAYDPRYDLKYVTIAKRLVLR